MAGVELRLGARMLFGAAETLSGASVRSGLATDVLSTGMRTKAAIGLRSGGDLVRLIGDDASTRLADDLFRHASNVEAGGGVGDAIAAALDGASSLLQHASTLI